MREHTSDPKHAPLAVVSKLRRHPSHDLKGALSPAACCRAGSWAS